jgi:hypothetical protein
VVRQDDNAGGQAVAQSVQAGGLLSDLAARTRVWNNWFAFWNAIYESAARSLPEGMAEMFTLQRLKPPPSLYKWPGDDQPDREPTERCGAPDRQCEVIGVIREWSSVGLPRPGSHRKPFPKNFRPS